MVRRKNNIDIVPTTATENAATRTEMVGFPVPVPEVEEPDAMDGGALATTPTEETTTTEVTETPATTEATTEATTTTETTEEAEEDEETLLPLSNYVREAQERAAASDAEAQALLTAYNEALKNGDSAMLRLLEDAEPKRDDNKEERLRKQAIIQGFGDLMSSIAMGAHAFGMKGAGYVPQLKESSALKSIEELNRLREEYAKKKEAWDGVMLNYKMGAEQAKVEGKKALATAAEARAKKDREDYEKLRIEAEKLGIDLNKFMIGEENKNLRTAATIAAAQERVDKAAAKAAEEKRKKGRTDAARRAYDHFNPWVATESGEGPMKRVSKYKDDLPLRDAQMWDNDDVKAALAYYDAGLSIEEAIEQVEEDKK